MSNQTNEIEAVDPRIVKFIRRHHVMTLATLSADCVPYCANLFYAYVPEENFFVFTSDDKTRHYGEMLANGLIAAAIVLETKVVGNVQGLQLQGRAELACDEVLRVAKGAYLKKFPYAAVVDLTLWIVRPTYMKFSDNRLGFGKKLLWHA